MALNEVVAVRIVAVMFAVLEVSSEVLATAVTFPVVETVATLVLSLLHEAFWVTSIVPLPRVATAVSCAVVGPEVRCSATELGLTLKAPTAEVTTMTVMLAEAPPLLAVTVVVPAPTAVMVPLVSTVAIEALALDHVAVEVTSEDWPPTVTAVAVICLDSGVPEAPEVESSKAVPERVTWSVELLETKKSPQPVKARESTIAIRIASRGVAPRIDSSLSPFQAIVRAVRCPFGAKLP